MIWILLTPVMIVLTHYVRGLIYDRRHPQPAEWEWDYYNDSNIEKWWRKRSESKGEWAFGAVFLSVALAVILNMYFDGHNRVPEDRYTGLYAMNDGLGTKGRFFLGSGTIETSPVYTYYYKDGEQYRLTYKEANDSYITYTEGTPQLIHHGSRQRYSNWLSLGADDWQVNIYKGDPYEFQVPQGSIQQNYVLDAQ